MKHRPPRLLIGLSIVAVGVLAVIALRLAEGESPTFHFAALAGLAFGALAIIAACSVIVLLVSYGILAVVRASTREFQQRHPGEFSIRVRNVVVEGERLPLPYYRFLTADTNGIWMWSHIDLTDPDVSFAASEISVLKRSDRETVVALGADERPIVEFEVVSAKPLALRRVHGVELDNLIESLSARLGRGRAQSAG